MTEELTRAQRGRSSPAARCRAAGSGAGHGERRMIANRGFALLFAGLAAFLPGCSTHQLSEPEIRLGNATVVGTWSGDHEIAAFRGVPFAAPPIGALRWSEPLPIELSDTIDARRFKPACMQGPHMVDWYRGLVARFGGDPGSFGVPEFSEDCLYLNIWAPQPSAGAGLPVMVWIHGGSHRGGWSYEPNYVGEELARLGVVVVSIPYRLDVFGFFSHPELENSNFGLLDQVAALQWVRDHIDRFGGDPRNVTVFGESAGASSIAYLLASPLGHGLFRRVIHQSAGYALLNEHTREQFLAAGLELEQRVLSERGESGLEALRNAPPGALLAAAESVYVDERPNIVIDGHSLPLPVGTALDRGLSGPVDLLIGSNADEWRMYLDPDTSEQDVAARIESYPEKDRPSIRQALEDSSDALSRMDRLVTAERFVCPSLELASRVAPSGGDTYVYYFNRIRPGAGGLELGAYHGAELPYVFNTHDDWLPTTATDRELGRLIRRYWVNFARHGDPNFEGAPPWPRFEATATATLVLGDAIEVVIHPDRPLCEALGFGRRH